MFGKKKAEVLSLAYGCIVRSILEEVEGDVALANGRLDLLGRHMGLRMAEEFLTAVPCEPCRTHRELLERLLLALRHFLGVEARVQSQSESEFSFFFNENPLDRNVALGEEHAGLQYSNVICGALRGALEAVNVKARCQFVADRLQRQPEGASAPGAPYELRLEIESTGRRKLEDFDD